MYMTSLQEQFWKGSNTTRAFPICWGVLDEFWCLPLVFSMTRQGHFTSGSVSEDIGCFFFQNTKSLARLRSAVPKIQGTVSLTFSSLLLFEAGSSFMFIVFYYLTSARERRIILYFSIVEDRFIFGIQFYVDQSNLLLLCFGSWCSDCVCVVWDVKVTYSQWRCSWGLGR